MVLLPVSLFSLLVDASVLIPLKKLLKDLEKKTLTSLELVLNLLNPSLLWLWSLPSSFSEKVSTLLGSNVSKENSELPAVDFLIAKLWDVSNLKLLVKLRVSTIGISRISLKSAMIKSKAISDLWLKKRDSKVSLNFKVTWRITVYILLRISTDPTLTLLDTI